MSFWELLHPLEVKGRRAAGLAYAKTKTREDSRLPVSVRLASGFLTSEWRCLVGRDGIAVKPGGSVEEAAGWEGGGARRQRRHRGSDC
eukprot:scaffold4273_cov215-Pinguiococcus_pyrenoidosus.AAC.1